MVHAALNYTTRRYYGEFDRPHPERGHSRSRWHGQDDLLEHLLFQGGAIAKPETIESGKTVSDYGEDEIARKISIHASLSSRSYKDIKINFIDTPGSSDFVGDVILAFRSCESALVFVDAKTGVQIETIKLWRNLEGRKKPRMVFVSKLDEERASFQGALDDLKEKFKVAPVAITIPMGEAAGFKGVVDVLNDVAYPLPSSHDQKEVGGPVPADMAAIVAEYKAKLYRGSGRGRRRCSWRSTWAKATLSQEETLLGLKEAFAAGR
jgi:elongation factor G